MEPLKSGEEPAVSDNGADQEWITVSLRNVQREPLERLRTEA
jgi:hypothetical protein